MKENSNMESEEDISEKYWESLSNKERLHAFCAVVKKLNQADLVDRGSYRYALYEVFKFGPEAYIPAMSAGYLDIHNALYDATEYPHYDILVKFKNFAKENNIPEEKIDAFLKENKYDSFFKL